MGNLCTSTKEDIKNLCMSVEDMEKKRWEKLFEDTGPLNLTKLIITIAQSRHLSDEFLKKETKRIMSVKPTLEISKGNVFTIKSVFSCLDIINKRLKRWKIDIAKRFDSDEFRTGLIVCIGTLSIYDEIKGFLDLILSTRRNIPLAKNFDSLIPNDDYLGLLFIYACLYEDIMKDRKIATIQALENQKKEGNQTVDFNLVSLVSQF
jgi:hypothetical protein